ncbi:hypothetical protein [Ornithinimicrobium cavernae]|uniref:hypothetical protein n=1 Tax=Ornithinimicrobium cavernae TaxID=2666047 RepID=UPI000D68B0BC|nr:hypothetical protein [Ornithinimicrobium cavernae]
MPNSLIFVVILAVWAAYLIQHWIRRRDHVATAKSVDRFSEAMRVLERRQSMPRADISAPSPRSYSVSLTRPAHPDVVVKRARPSVPAGDRRPSTRRPLHRFPVTQRRAAALAAGALAAVSGVLVAALSPLSWWVALAGVSGLLLAITYVRHSVSAESRGRATSPVRPGRSRSASPVRAGASRSTSPVRAGSTRPASRSAGAGAARGGSTSVRPAATRPAAARSAASSSVTVPEVHEVVQQETVPAARPARRAARATELYDLQAFEAPAAVQPPADLEPEAPVAATEPAPGTWAPVPVPPPTYTLKARAPRREPEQARDRRMSTQVEDLPFDGHALALDEEFEDLPPVHSVG